MECLGVISRGGVNGHRFSGAEEEERDEEGRHTSSCEFDVGSLRQTNNVEEVTSSEQLPLVAPWRYDFNRLLLAREWDALGVVVVRVVLELALHVLEVKVLNQLFVLRLDFVVVHTGHAYLSVLFVVELDAFFGHHTHEEVTGVRKLRASVPDALEEVH